ncbi:hypothetical protein B0H10DRAFT_2073432 [Mycena sp. CBHHK59/15]|nr:hypothetical protein B0H10DRAFT_2073432 [Mycena sp. CBHHK59/15]
MPRLDTTIYGYSPLIMYLGNWTQQASNKAAGGSWFQTETQDASATLEFHGTNVTVYASKNDNHGNFTISLDGNDYTINGFAEWPGIYKIPIFSSPILKQGSHILTITNSNWTFLDIDWITWSSEVGPPGNSSLLQETMVDDADPAFTYFPHGAWDMNPPDFANFSGGTGHSTAQDQASVNYTFNGDAVSLYGTTGPQNSQYMVQRDDQPSRTFVATRAIFSSQTLLYYGDNFGLGNHTLTLINQTPDKLLEIDYVVVHTVNIPTSSSASSTPTVSHGRPTFSSNTPSPQTKLPASAIISIAVAAIVFVFLLAALWFLLRRNKTLWMRLQRGYMVQSQFDSFSPQSSFASPAPVTRALPAVAQSKGAYISADGDDSFKPPTLNRAVTAESHLSASTLVADNGSYLSTVIRQPVHTKKVSIKQSFFLVFM